MRKMLLVALACALLAPLGARAGDSTGVTDTTITIGLHAPLTGAEPVQPDAFDEGKDLYWKWLKAHGESINGRDVQLVFADDNYNPTTAVAVCNDMATDQNAFLLAGFAGTAEVNACSQYADPRGIPYVSTGVEQAGLDNLHTYFALSATWAQQAPIIAQYIMNKLGSRADRYGTVPLLTVPVLNLPVGGPDGHIVVGFVRPNTPDFDETANALKNALQSLGAEYREYDVVREGSSNEMQQLAVQMRTDQVDVLVDALAPTETIELAINMRNIQYSPVFLGISMRSGFDETAQIACAQARSVFDGASFFSPWPAFSEAQSFDPDFVAAAKEFAPDVDTTSAGGDTLFALWGLMKQIAGMLNAAGTDLTRESFISAMNAGFSESTGVYAPVSFSTGNHFGAQAVHRIEADCNTDQAFHEKDAFVSGYPKS